MGPTSVGATNHLTQKVVRNNLRYQRRGNSTEGIAFGIVEKAEHACYVFDEHAEDHAAAWIAAARDAAGPSDLDEARQLVSLLRQEDDGFWWSRRQVAARLQTHPEPATAPTPETLAQAAEEAGKEFRAVVDATTDWPRVPKRAARREAEAVLRCKMAAYRYLSAVAQSTDPGDAARRRLVALAALALLS